MIKDIDDIAEELFWKGNLAKKLPRFAENDELNDILLNQKLEEEWEIHQYLNR